MTDWQEFCLSVAVIACAACLWRIMLQADQIIRLLTEIAGHLYRLNQRP